MLPKITKRFAVFKIKNQQRPLPEQLEQVDNKGPKQQESKVIEFLGRSDYDVRSQYQPSSFQCASAARKLAKLK